jgi:transposase
LRRHELTDKRWEVLKELLPEPAQKGRKRRDRRQVLSGIFWILRTGAPWRDLPERFGPWKTVYHCFNKWRKDGTWDRMLQALQVQLDREDKIEWDLWCIDGSTIRASRSAAGAGQKGARTSPQTTL